ncbi:MAG TPA: hypothetical protein VKR58_03360 [Aquella sp.]|nr:hypothetical protein [Aquella sp.]
MINLEIIDSQNPYNELAHDYWLLKNPQEFVFNIKQLQLKHNLKQNQITNMVKNLCFAYSPEIICSDCGIPYAYASRNDFSFKKNIAHLAGLVKNVYKYKPS